MFRSLLVTLLVAGAVLVAVPSTSRYMNCGGNSAALCDVQNICLVVSQGMAERADGSFRFSEVLERDAEILRSQARDHWIRKARFLVTTDRVTEAESGPPQLVVVCDTPFTNVPERRFWAAPPTHAAGYSDGSTRLLAVKEFAALEKGRFAPLDVLFPRSGKVK